MELYKELAKKCKIEENSYVYVPDEPLRTFVRLTIRELAQNEKESFVQNGYTSGLFDGTGNVNFNSVKELYVNICDEIKKYKTEKNSMIGIDTYFGINIEYIKKKDFVKKM
jgi:hypothetical protein